MKFKAKTLTKRVPKFKILTRIRKIITKQPLFAKTKKEIRLFDGFFGLEDPQKPKNENTSNADT